MTGVQTCALPILIMSEVLTLQITKDSFDEILSGRQKEETRNVYPNTAKRYLVDPDNSIELRKYDYLYLINGRQKNSRRLKVEVKGVEMKVLTDEKGEDIIYEENGEEYIACRVFYKLGKIVSTENIN